MTEQQVKEESKSKPNEWILGLGNKTDFMPDRDEALFRLGQYLACGSINMLHSAPWSATEALFRGAAQRLPPSGVLLLYGPFKRGRQHTAESNQRFDDRLRAEDPRWGVRDVDDVQAVASAVGFGPPEIIPMPANNLSLVFRRT